MPWKAGHGVTHQIAIAPSGASLDDFSWRLSIATIGRSTTFSAFAGYDRTFLLLDGHGARDGVVLDFGPRGRASLGTYDSFAFPGEWPAHCTLGGGAVRDLNVMTRRSQWRHRLEILGGATVQMAVPPGSVHFLFVLDGVAVVAGPDATEAIEPLQGLLIDPRSSASSLRVAASGATLVSIRFTPA